MSYAQFDAIQDRHSLPGQIREWSYGEVKKPETINYRTLKPERDGLFCERIFGPTKDWECHCGKYKKIRYKGKICDRCGVEVTRPRSAASAWATSSWPRPSATSGISRASLPHGPAAGHHAPDSGKGALLRRLYRHRPRRYPAAKRTRSSPRRSTAICRRSTRDDFEAGMGAEAVKKLLQDIDLEELVQPARAELKDASGQKKARIVKRLEVVEAFRISGNKPEWMIIDVVPVIPPELRPMVQLDGGRFATSDLNDLYRRVINRNNRLKRLIQLNAPDIIVRNEKRMLQEAVDALIDNGRRGRAVTGANNRALKACPICSRASRAASARTCWASAWTTPAVPSSWSARAEDLPVRPAQGDGHRALPPFVMKKLVEDGLANNIKSAKKMVDKGAPRSGTPWSSSSRTTRPAQPRPHPAPPGHPGL